MPTASIQSLRNGITPLTGSSRDDLQIGDVVTVESMNIGTGYAWTLAYRPDGSTASLLPAGGEITKGPLTFQVDKEGPYLIGLQYSTPKVDVASIVVAGNTLTLNGIVLNAVAGAPAVNDFAVTGNAVTDAAAIAAAINLASNGFATTLLAHNVAGSTEVVITPVVDGTAVTIVSSTGNMVVGTATTEQFVRLRALTAFGSLHLVAAGEQYGGSNPPVPVDITPVGWTNEQNNNLLSLLSLIESTSSSGNIVYVDPISGDYNTIQAAIDYCVSQIPSASSQWVVAVRPGIYQEQLTFAAWVNVIGWPGVVEDQSFLMGAETVKVQQTALMGAHAINLAAANETLNISGIFFERPGAAAIAVIEEVAGNQGRTHISHCRMSAAGTGPCYQTVGGVSILGDCVLQTDGGRSVVVGSGSKAFLQRVWIGGTQCFSATHGSNVHMQDCRLEPSVSGNNAIDVVYTDVAQAGATLVLEYTSVYGTVTSNTGGVGASSESSLNAAWSHFSAPGSIAVDGTNVTGGSSLGLGATRHGAISVAGGATYTATVPADTIFYDNALVSHSRLIGATEIAGDLTASNVQDALDEIYSYAINVRTLDDAYDAGMGGGGLGRDITADAEAVRILDGNPPGSPTPLTSTDGQLKVVSKIEIGSIDKAEIKLDPNPWGMGAEITLGEELWIGNAPYGTPTFIWANSTTPATYHNYDLILSAHPTDGGDRVGSIIVRGGAGLTSGKGTDPSGGNVHLVGGDALGENLPPAASDPDGGTVYIAPGGTRFPATAGNVGTILLGRPEDATRAVLGAPIAYAPPAANGTATFGTDLGAFTISLTAGDVIATAIGKFNNTQYVIASESPAGFIQLESATRGPLSQVFYVGGDAAINTALGNFQGALQSNGTWPSHMELVVSAANEISFGPNAATGPLIYNADTGKLTVPGVIDPTGMIYTESTLTNITLAANGWTGTNVGGLYVSDGTDGRDDNHLYYVFEDGSTVKLSGSGTGDVAGPASSQDNAVVRFDGITGKVIQDSSATLADNGDLTLGGSVTIDINVAGVDAYTLINRFNNTASSAVIHTTGATPDWTTGTIAGNSDYTLSDGGGTERFKVSTGGAVTINNSYTLPTTDGAAAGEVLTTDAAGNVTWAAASGGMTNFFIEDVGGNTSSITNGDTLNFVNTAGETTVGVSGDNVTIGLPNTGVPAGAYTNANITVDSTGRLTAASSGGGGLPAPTAEGQILYAPTPAAFVQATPLVNASGFILVNSSGNMVVI